MLHAAREKSPNAFLDAVPTELREHVQAESGLRDRHGVRLRLQLTIQLVIAMAFRPDLSIPCVLEELVELVGVPPNWKGGATPPSSTITKGRDRLGWEPVRSLFRHHVEFMEKEGMERACTWRGFRVAALDGTTLRTPDTPQNEAAFGRPAGRFGPGGFPMLRGLALVDVFDHHVRAAVYGPYLGKGTGELSLARNYLLEQIPPNTLILEDRGFCAYEWLRDLREGGRHHVTRLKTGKNTVTPVKKETLTTGRDWLVEFPVPNSLRPRAGEQPLRLRMIKWSLPKRRSKRLKKPGVRKARQKKARARAKRCVSKKKAPPRHLYLLTSLTDSRAFPWKEIAQLYLLRWEVEFAFREIKATLTNRKVEFRSKKPRRVLQEAYALLLAYNATRMRMTQAAEAKGLEPRRLSFKRCLVAVRRAYLTGSDLLRLLRTLALYVLEDRPPRSYPRAVKCRSTRFPTKPNATAA